MAVPAITPVAKTTAPLADAAARTGARNEGSSEGGFAAVLENAGGAMPDAPGGAPVLPLPPQGDVPELPAPAVAPVDMPVAAMPGATVTEPAAPEPDAPTPAPAPAADVAAPQVGTVEFDPSLAQTVPGQLPVPSGAVQTAIAPEAVVEEKPGKDEPGKNEPGKRKDAATKAQIDVQVPPQTPLAQPVAVSLPSADAALQTAAPADGEPPVHDRSAAAPQVDLVAAGETAPDQAPPEARLSTSLFTQTLDAAAVRPALTGPASPYAPARQSGDTTVSVREGRFGTDIGVTIARAAGSGPDGTGSDLLIRLDPRHMGRVDVRLSFEHDGVLRAVVSADNPAALDLLRRESGDLGRALADAGVRSDNQSLRFDANGSGGGGNAGGQPRQGQRAQGPDLDFAGNGNDDPIHRPLASSGHVDLMA